jgi:DNA-binding Lrp family transcriptional regulator
VPLKSGYSREAISARIRRLIKEGYPKDQAVAISYAKAREAAKKISDPRRRQAILRRLSKKGGSK